MLPKPPSSAAKLARRLRPPAMAAALLAAALPVSLTLAQTHQVRPGDTLSSIAVTYGVSMEQLAHQNAISNPNLIFAGQVLTIGAAAAAATPDRTHTVRPGESLSAIANSYGVTLSAMVTANSLANPNFIYIGQRLTVPGGGGGIGGATPVSTMMTRAQVEQYIRDTAIEHGISPSLMAGLAWMESGFNQNLTSHAGAIGVMQIMPATADWALDYLEPSAVNWRTDPRDNIRLGVAIFAHMHWQAGRNTELALGFYYQGWYSIELYGMFAETRQYIANVMALAGRF